MASLKALRNLEYDANSTAGITQLPATILEALIPGYSMLSRIISDVLGFDVSIFISLFAVLAAAWTGGSFAWKHISSLFLYWFSASITIDMQDPIYDHMLAWASEQKSLMSVRSLRGHSAGESMDEDDTDIKVEEDFAEDAIFNFNDWAAKAPPKYEPHASSGMFRHTTKSGTHWFKFDRDRERVPSGWMGTIQDREKLILTVVGRKTSPLKELIMDARDSYLSRQTTMTTIQRPRPKEHRGRGRQAWQRVSARPSRPMATVVLDDTQKATILKDINDFLHPRTPRWYSNRGIPYRRGYLFHGPPGTGKTSLSFALAGVFGLDIYCLSLSEATLTEEDLILLFNSLPKRCVVLLEDIDTAGVFRRKSDPTDEDKRPNGGKGRRGRKGEQRPEESKDDTSAAAQTIAKEVARAMQTATDNSEAARKGPSLNNQGISLSGLLNAIDGVASQEGRVLVMTTNHPEKLDDALVRPGRVDMKIQFTLASHQQIRELFVRMYCADDEFGEPAGKLPTKLGDILPKSTIEGGEDVVGTDIMTTESEKSLLTPPETLRKVDLKEISSFAHDVEKLAEKFADLLPDGTFSPAEIQGFLLTRKKSPLQAVLDVVEWRDGEVGKKMKKKGENTGTESEDNDHDVDDHESDVQNMVNDNEHNE